MSFPGDFRINLHGRRAQRTMKMFSLWSAHLPAERAGNLVLKPKMISYTAERCNKTALAAPLCGAALHPGAPRRFTDKPPCPEAQQIAQTSKHENSLKRHNSVGYFQINYPLREEEARFAAFSGLIRTFTTLISGLAWVAKLQMPIRHFAAGFV